jgi:hypothetical protein
MTGTQMPLTGSVADHIFSFSVLPETTARTAILGGRRTSGRKPVVTRAEEAHMEQVHARLDALAGMLEKMATDAVEHDAKSCEIQTWWALHNAAQHEVDEIEELMGGRIKTKS